MNTYLQRKMLWTLHCGPWIWILIKCWHFHWCIWFMLSLCGRRCPDCIALFGIVCIICGFLCIWLFPIDFETSHSWFWCQYVSCHLIETEAISYIPEISTYTLLCRTVEDLAGFPSIRDRYIRYWWNIPHEWILVLCRNMLGVPLLPR